MFGTLVIQLPSDYDGGELRVRHRDEEEIFDFSGSKGVNDYNYAAFYADCEHELCEVTRGYRLCLVYNLVYSGDGACPVPIDNSEVAAKVVEDMREWEQDDDSLPYMAYVLDHNYCEASLSFGLLKNGDRAKAEVILEAEKQMMFCLYLGIVTLEQHCTLGGGYNGRRRYEYGYSREDYYVEDIEKEELYVVKLVSSNGKFLDNINSIELTHDAIVPELGKPTDENFKPYTGYAAATLERFYLKAALFIWPMKHTILVTGDVNDAIEKLDSKICESQDNQQLQGECEDLAKEIVAVSTNSEFCPYEANIIILMSCLKQLKAIDLVCDFFKAICIHNLDIVKHQAFCETVVEIGNAFGWEQLEEALVALLETAVAREINIACNFLSSLATGSLSSQRLKVCQKMVDVICHTLTNEQDINPLKVSDWFHLTARGFRSKGFVCELFKTLYVLQCEDQLGVVTQSFFRQPNRFSLLDTLVPAAIELHETMKENSTTALTSLISQCVIILEQLTQQAPTWSIQTNLDCRCDFCTKLAAFLKDPQKSVTRFHTKQSNRSHLEQKLIAHHSTDVSGTTECHSAVPYTLVVTKNDGKFKTYRTRLALLNRIRPILGQENPPVKRQKLDDVSCIVID